MSLPVQIKKEPGLGPSGPVTTANISTGLLSEVKKEPTLSDCSTIKAQLASKVKLTLMQAWRERWTEIQWAIQLKKLLAAYSDESVDIAEILMQQALVGNSPNMLILSYLKHSVLSLMIPFNTVMGYITKFDDFSRPHCVLALLRLAGVFGRKISMSLCQDSPLELVRTMLKLIHWLVKALLKCLQECSKRLSDSRQGQMTEEYFEIMNNSSCSIVAILERPPVRSLFRIARMDCSEDYREFEQSEINARGIMSQVPASALSKDLREKINSALTLLSRLEEQDVYNEIVLEVLNSPIIPCINGLVTLEAVLNTSNQLQPFVDQVLMVSSLTKLSMPQLCLEILRACFMGFQDTVGHVEQLPWAIFALLKVPHILTTMKQQKQQMSNSDVKEALDMLLECSHLLDQIDIKSRADMMGPLLTELQKVGILTEEEKTAYMQKRADQHRRLCQSDVSGSLEKILSRVTQAEGTLPSILKSLDSDPQKNADSMVKVLTIMFQQRHSFDTLRLVAACTGHLHDFMSKLIRINDDAARISNKSQLFDLTFVMVISVFQQHGLEIALPSRDNEALSSRDNENSLVMQWARRWLPERGTYKNCELANISGEEQDKVDYLLNLMLSSNDIAPCGPIQSWKDLIKYIPYALQEVIYAMEHMSITMERVQEIIDNIRRQNMKSFILVSATYLCSYINMVEASPKSNCRAKPLHMLEMLLNPTGSDIKQVVQAIIDNIVYKVVPERQARKYQLPSKYSTTEMMSETLRFSFNRGWLTLDSIHKLDQLLAVRGHDWFCWELVEHVLQNSHAEDSSQSLSLALSIFHMDLERLTVSLLRRLLPRVLASPQTNLLAAPRGSLLAKLCVLTITSTHVSKVGSKEPYIRRFVKTGADDEDDTEPLPAKIRKGSEPQLTLSLDEFNLDAILDKVDGDLLPSFDAKEPLNEPLNKALANLFNMMSSILNGTKLTPRSWFIVSFLKEAIKCGAYSRFILQFMPHNMLNQVMRAMPGIFTDEEILRICDLSTVAGRKSAAKAVTINAVTPPLTILNST